MFKKFKEMLMTNENSNTNSVFFTKMNEYILKGGLYRLEQGWDVHKKYVWGDSACKQQGDTNLRPGSVVMIMKLETPTNLQYPVAALEILHQHQLYKMYINYSYFTHRHEDSAFEFFTTKEFIKLE